MNTSSSTFTAALLIASITAPALALAANPHFLVGPTITDDGDGFTATGTLAGLGNKDVTIELAATATVTTTCTNPAGNIAPGQTKETTVSQEQTLSPTKNGSLTFNISIDEQDVEDDINLNGVCPNGKWTAHVEDVSFSDPTLTISQGGKTLFTCSGVDPTTC